MKYYTNIAVRYRGEKLRMILDPENLVIYIGRPRLFSTDVPSTSWDWTIPVESIEHIRLDDFGSLIIKHYNVQVKLKTPPLGRPTEALFFQLWTSKSEGKAFLRNYNSWQLDRAVEKRDREVAMKNQEDYILAPFKSSARIDLVEFAKKNKDNICKCLAHPEVCNQPLSDEVSLRLLKGFVINYIKDDKLNGIVGPETNEYVDRDFIEKPRKVVSVNVHMDFNALVEQLGNKGINLTAIQCPQCNATCTVPPEGTRFQCESCSAVIEVTDIVEKFKPFLT